MKKYQVPQIAEKDVVLAGSNVSMAELIAQAMTGYTEGMANGAREIGRMADGAKSGAEGAKLVESARELARLAEAAKSSGRMSEAVKAAEGS